MLSLHGLADEVRGGHIPALSIKQPWPHRIFHEDKDVENRDWPTRHRGWFIVHAGKSYDGGKPPQAHAALPLGGIVGMARVVDCVTSLNSKWFFGRYGFVLRDAFPVTLIPCRGQLSFFLPPRDALAALADQLDGMEIAA